jgi:hypothetical protein
VAALVYCGASSRRDKVKTGAIMSRRVLLICAIAVAGALAQSQLRSLTGKVTTESGAPVKGAAVKIKDLTTLQIRSYITTEDGSYRFANLLSDRDYELFAQLGGKQSSKKTLSRFDSKQQAVIDLKIPD